MKYTILHISDIHKSEDADLVNLLQSLKDDCARYTKDANNLISKPDFIVVSGDVIAGSNGDDANNDIIKQYQEAEKFLNDLVNEFLGGVKKRIIIVPGNHDINWEICKKSFTILENRDESRKQFFAGSKMLRWSWTNYSFYNLTNTNLYASRFKYYVEFYNRFFKDIRKIDDCEKEAYIEDIPDFNTTFVLFNSCSFVDHLNQAGCINPSALVRIMPKIQKYYCMGRLVIGVWHHNVTGLPMQNNYLDYRILDEMMISGISIGLFGHQHKSAVISKHHSLANEKDLTLISSGCLYGNSKQLSNGYSRQYNIIDIEQSDRKAIVTLHVRKDKSEDFYDIPKWDQDLIVANGKLSYTTEIELAVPDLTKELSRIDDEVRKTKDFEKACLDIMQLGLSNERARIFFDQYIERIEDDAFIVNILDDVNSDAEAVRLMEAAMNIRNKELSAKIKSLDFIVGTDNPLLIELRSKL